MGYKDITEGDKTARPIGCRLVDSEKTGNVAVEVVFEFEEPSTGNPERLAWQGWMSEAAIDMTKESLLNSGFNLEAMFARIDHEQPIDHESVYSKEKEVKLVIEVGEYEGRPQPRVKWVNRLGGSSFTGLAPEVAKKKFSDPRIKAAFLSARAADGKAVKNSAPQETKQKTKKPVPF